MKISLLHYSCDPVIGGVERVISGQARMLRQFGHEVSLYCSHGGDAHTRRIPEGEAMPRMLDALCAEHEILIVHNVLTMPFDMQLTHALGRLPGRFPNVRFIAWTHDIAASNPDLSATFASISKATPGFDYISVSKLCQQQLRASLGIESRIIPNGTDAAEILNIPSPLASLAENAHLLDGRTVMFHPARLLRRKNVEFGIHLTAALRKNGHSTSLILTGAKDPHNATSAQYAKSLMELRSRLELDDAVLFASEYFPVQMRELAALYQLADLLFFPSHSEGFGLPILEAAIHRIPILCSDIPALREIAPQGTLYFHPDTKPDALALPLIQKLENDPYFISRKQALKTTSWNHIYFTHYMPLLEKN